ncbi:caspase recruitment domain-containing protein 18-like [Entelurus aequoreus]|uniref:caspase recruitment domain-containing protein 18-like n=1 Tax=Entelurus aequoreus TaxID=161455 RepID=UPI002B1DD2A4|nr:caspase recruitment domain-containing protein 18-like [Entelurus aequoreus]
MAAELFDVRAVLADSLSLPAMENILDDLLTSKVLSDTEREALLEGNPTRKNKARYLIDMVRGKSDDASWKMIGYLKKHDPELFKKLGLPTQSFKGAAGGQNSRTWKKNDEKVLQRTGL